MAIMSEQVQHATGKRYQSELLQHMFAHILCNHRHTITGLLETLGREQQDWSKAYRLYQKYVDETKIFNPIIDGILKLIPNDTPLVIAVDDSHIRKTGMHVDGAGWYKDPLGPPFHVNLTYAQKFIQLSAAVPDPNDPKRSRMIPIAVALIPKLPKPSENASPEELKRYAQIKEKNTPCAYACRMLQNIREYLDLTGYKKKDMCVCGDGHYSTSTLIPNLPPRTVYIGRTRSDMNLHAVPSTPESPSVGRPKSYGEKLQTPEELRKDKSIPWNNLNIRNGNETISIRYKEMEEAKWQPAGEKTVVKIVIIAPLRYKKRKNGQWRYTKPAYLICTDTELPIQKLIQAYFWRWGIEVNFREEKQLFGTGEAQIRNAPGVSTAPIVSIAAYATLLLAGIKTYGFNSSPQYSPPKWYKQKQKSHLFTSDLIKQVRKELMLKGSYNFLPLYINQKMNMNGEKLFFWQVS